jgi:hypothetical protein
MKTAAQSQQAHRNPQEPQQKSQDFPKFEILFHRHCLPSHKVQAFTLTQDELGRMFQSSFYKMRRERKVKTLFLFLVNIN